MRKMEFSSYSVRREVRQNEFFCISYATDTLCHGGVVVPCGMERTGTMHDAIFCGKNECTLYPEFKLKPSPDLVAGLCQESVLSSSQTVS